MLETTTVLPPPLCLSFIGHLLNQNSIAGPIVPLEGPEVPWRALVKGTNHILSHWSHFPTSFDPSLSRYFGTGILAGQHRRFKTSDETLCADRAEMELKETSSLHYSGRPNMPDLRFIRSWYSSQRGWIITKGIMSRAMRRLQVVLQSRVREEVSSGPAGSFRTSPHTEMVPHW